MKRALSIVLCIFVIVAVFPMTANADMGPKPSVVIDFNGLDGKTYYATLLSKTKTTGPYSALDDDNKEYAYYQEGDEDYNIFLKFVEYEDSDGFYFLQFFQDCSQTQQFNWTYYPPQTFKILLYFPETNGFIISDKCYERYAFDSYFTADITGLILSAEAQSEGGIIAEKSYNYTDEILSLIVRILLTLAIEFGIALLFGFREKRQIYFIIFVNIVTQITLNLALNIINYLSGQMAFVLFYVLLEIAVFVAEAILYTAYLRKNSEKEVPGWKPCVYALVANSASFALGLGLAYYIPGIF